MCSKKWPTYYVPDGIKVAKKNLIEKKKKSRYPSNIAHFWLDLVNGFYLTMSLTLLDMQWVHIEYTRRNTCDSMLLIELDEMVKKKLLAQIHPSSLCVSYSIVVTNSWILASFFSHRLSNSRQLFDLNKLWTCLPASKRLKRRKKKKNKPHDHMQQSN